MNNYFRGANVKEKISKFGNFIRGAFQIKKFFTNRNFHFINFFHTLYSCPDMNFKVTQILYIYRCKKYQLIKTLIYLIGPKQV